MDLKIVELHEKSDPKYMVMHVHVLNDQMNHNKAVFTEDFIDGVVANKQEYLGLPFLVDREALESGEKLTHKLRGGALHTDQIGSFVDFWKEDVDGVNTLVGEIRILKRFPTVCETIIDLFENGELLTSCEVMVAEFKETSDDGVRTIHYNEGNNSFIGSAIVTNPAMPEAKATLLVAEAYEKDVTAEDKVITSGTVDANEFRIVAEGVDVKPVEGVTNVAKTMINEIEYHNLYSMLSRVMYELENDRYNIFDIVSLRTSSIVVAVYDYNTEGNKLFHAKYEVNGFEQGAVSVTVEDVKNWVEVYQAYVPIAVGDINEDLLDDELREIIVEIQEENTELKKEMDNLSKEVENTELSSEEAQKQIDKLEKKVAELEATIVKLKEDEKENQETIKQLKEDAKELNEYKVKFEQAELEKTQKTLTARFEKLFDEETFKSDRIQTLINECDESGLNSLFVEMSTKEDNSTQVQGDVVINSQEETVSDRDYLFEPIKK